MLQIAALKKLEKLISRQQSLPVYSSRREMVMSYHVSCVGRRRLKQQIDDIKGV